MLSGNVAAIATGARWHEVGAPRWLGTASAALGAVGLVCGFTVLAIHRKPGFGIVERGSIYPVTAWQLMVGTHLMHRALRDNARDHGLLHLDRCPTGGRAHDRPTGTRPARPSPRPRQH